MPLGLFFYCEMDVILVAMVTRDFNNFCKAADCKDRGVEDARAHNDNVSSNNQAQMHFGVHFYHSPLSSYPPLPHLVYNSNETHKIIFATLSRNN